MKSHVIKNTITPIVMVVLLLLLTHSVFGQEAQISFGGNDTELEVGQTYTFFLSLRNSGVSNSSTYGFADISFKKVDSDEVPALSIDVISNGFLNWDAFNTGQQIWNRNGSEITANYTLMSFYEQDWTNSEQKSVILEITPNEPGDFYIQFRGTFTETNLNTHIDEHPNDLEGDDIDQQGWPIFQQLISVTNIAPEFDITSPNGWTVIRRDPEVDNSQFEINWTDSDPDNNAHISLFYGPECNEGQNPIVADLFEDEDSNNYLWNTTGVPAGSYRVWGFIYDGINEPVYDCATGLIIRDPMAFTITPSGVQEAYIGDVLQWDFYIFSPISNEAIPNVTIELYLESQESPSAGSWITDNNGRVTVELSITQELLDHRDPLDEIHHFYTEIRIYKENYYLLGNDQSYIWGACEFDLLTGEPEEYLCPQSEQLYEVDESTIAQYSICTNDNIEHGLTDVTDNHNDLLPSFPVPEGANISEGFHANGFNFVTTPSRFVTESIFSQLDEFTIEFYVLGSSGGYSDENWFRIYLNSLDEIGDCEISLDSDGSYASWNGSHFASSSTVFDNEWHHVVLQNSGDQLSFIIDGVPIGNTFFDDSGIELFNIEVRGAHTGTLILDELRISNIVRYEIPAEPEPDYSYGTTVIVHGYIMNGFSADWTIEMAQAIIDRLGAGEIYTIIDGSISNLPVVSNLDSEGKGEKIIVFDWEAESDKPVLGYAEAAADALLANLIQGTEENKWNLDQLHFIGHSRGAIVSSEVIQRLGYYQELNLLPDIINSTVDQDIHFTVLDGHPMENYIGDCIAHFLNLNADDYDVNLPYIMGDREVNGSQVPQAIVSWDNVGYIDNYFQGECNEVHASPNGVHNIIGIDNKNNFQLDDIWNSVPGNNHSAVHKWYTGTISRDNRLDWYPNGQARSLGFNKSKSLKDSGVEDYAVESRVLYSLDQSLNQYEIFNGDFSMKSSSFWNNPGWAFHGGGGSGNVGEIDGNNYLKLNAGDANRKHNLLYIPKNANAITFDMKIQNEDGCLIEDCDINTSNRLELLIGDEVIDWWHTRIKTCNFAPCKAFIPTEYLGSTNTITFRLNDPDEGIINDLIVSEVWIDDIRFNYTESNEAYLSTCSPIDVIITDENGNFVSRDSSTIENTYYEVYPVDETDTIAVVKIRDPKLNSLYNIEVIPWTNTDPSELYSLYVSFGEEKIVYADHELIANIPQNGYLISTLDTGSIQGIISNNSNKIIGVPVDLFDEAEGIVASAITDENGQYEFGALANGTYTVSITPPLGFTSESEVQEVTVRGLPHEVNFEVVEGSADKLRHIWWWKVYLDDLRNDGPRDDVFTKEDVNLWLQRIFNHYYSRLDNFAIQIENATYKGVSAQPLIFDDLAVILLDTHEGTYESYVRKNLLISLLNVASGKMLQTKVVTADSATASQAITYFYQVYEANKNESNFEERNNLIVAYLNLRNMFMGQMISAGIVPLTTPNVMYKGGSDGDDLEMIPTEFTLTQNYPNPFNPTTSISFSLPEASNVKLEVYNINGQVVTTLADGQFEVGVHQLTWDGRETASGMYFYKLTTNNFSETKKMLLLK